MKEKITLLDGAVGTELWAKAEKNGWKKEPVWKYNIDHPQIVAELAREYADAGSDIILSNTFGANAPSVQKSSSYSVSEVVSAGVKIAKEAVGGRGIRVGLDAGPLSELMEACQYFFETTGRRVTFEYAVMEGENDSDADAAALAKLLRGRGAHVNLIPVNKVRERSYHATRRAAQDFMQRLERLGIHATVRRTLGSDIEAACGQLRHETEKDTG